MAATAAANNKFIAADEVHKLIITSRQRASRRYEFQFRQSPMIYNIMARVLTDADLLARLFARIHRRFRCVCGDAYVHTYAYPLAGLRYNGDSDFPRVSTRSRAMLSFAQEHARMPMTATYNSISRDLHDAP